MIFTGSYWYYGVIQFALIAVIILLARFVVGRHRVFDAVVVRMIGIYLLFYKLNEYGPLVRYPLDLSAVTYFFFGLAAFIPYRPLKAAASFSAILSGLIYAVTMAFFPESHLSSLTVTSKFFYINMAMFNHNLLLLGGIFMAACARFKREDTICILGWFAFFFAYLALMTEGYGIEDKTSSILQILDGELVAKTLGVPTTAAFYAIYYFVCVLLSAALLILFVLLNRALTRRLNVFLPPIIAVSEYSV